MQYAIDRFQLGKEKELCAKSLFGTYIASRKTRFFCPECGEIVYWRKRGGTKPDEFYHSKKTSQSLECDKRTDGRSGLYLYEREGMPLYLSEELGGKYYLYIVFTSLGNEVLHKAEKENSKLNIITNGISRMIPINEINFFSDSATPVRIKTIPCGGDNIKFEILPSMYEIQKKWSDYADGFSSNGAIFLCGDHGGRKIRRGDSISTFCQYYLVSRRFNSPYSEIVNKKIGSIILNEQDYAIYQIEVRVSIEKTDRYKMISNYFQNTFGVGLLEKTPTLVPLWPPVVEDDNSMVPIRRSGNLYCAVSSSNEDAVAYQYCKNEVFPMNLEREEGGIQSIKILLNKNEIIVSVDRKYVGREIFIRNQDIRHSSFHYEYSLIDMNGNSLDMEKITKKDLLNASQFKSNAKMEMYIGNSKWAYQHISIREETKLLPTRDDAYEILLLIENMILFRRQICVKSRTSKTIDDILCAPLTQYHDKAEVPVPRWVNGLLSNCYEHGYIDVGEMIKRKMCSGKMAAGDLKVLHRIYTTMHFDK